MVINSGPMEWICDMLSHTSHYLVHAQYLINNSWGRIPDCVPAVSAMTIVTGKMSWRCWCGILYECLRHAPPATQSSDIMIIQVLHCPHCHGTDIVRHAHPSRPATLPLPRVPRGIRAHLFTGRCLSRPSPEIKDQIIEMAMNASGIRWVRRAIYFSKTGRMHDVVIGRFINRCEFGQLL